MATSNSQSPTATRTIHDLFTATITTTVYTSSSPSGTSRASPQGGIFEHSNPTHYDLKNPIILFIIQAALVLILTRLLHFPLSRLRQPRVIAEVITGIILGPSIMGRIPSFTSTIFPTASLPAFTLAANLGLVLFLFLVGLEVDLRFLASNWRIALSVGFAGMALPFGLGCAIAVGLFHQFHQADTDGNLAPISMGVYMLFIAVAMAITAFPVLCRILTSLHLLQTPVGVIVLSAGVANDVIGWILLALCVALVNTSSGLTALWILLTALGYILFLIYAVRPAFMYLLRKTNSLQDGPTQSVVAITVLMVLASAFFTGVIGIHPIFGAFMIGLICPHQGGFAIKLTEKLEDLVSVLFLPLYFALSGLSTNLGLLDSGITWAYVIGVIVVAFAGKIIGGTLASRLNGLVWRESLTIGCLMSCKGLVELIVLNIGLQAKILTVRTFTIFVVMALVTTFATTPLTTLLYPPWYQRKLELWKQGKIDWDGNPIESGEDGSDDGLSKEAKAIGDQDVVKQVLVYLRLDGLPSLFTLVTLLGSRSDSTSNLESPTVAGGNTKELKSSGGLTSTVSLGGRRRHLDIHALRLLELTDRDSSVMKVSELESYAVRDPIIKAFGTFAVSRNAAVGGQIAVVPEHSYATTMVGRARETGAELIVMPWSETGGMSEIPGLFDKYVRDDPLDNRDYAGLVAGVFEKATNLTSVAVWIDKSVFRRSVGDDEIGPASPISFEPPLTRQLSRTARGLSVWSHAGGHRHVDSSGQLGSCERYRVVVLYTGSDDDLFAVRFSLQLARSGKIDGVIVRDLTRRDEGHASGEDHNGRREEVCSMFEMIKTSVVEGDLKDKIVFDTARSGTIVEFFEGPVENLVQDDTVESIILMGRNWNERSTGGDDVRTLGGNATRMVQWLRQSANKASLLVVQVRREWEEEDPKLARKV